MQNTNDLKIGLVLLAAGYGSRFGGDKQLCVIGPQDTIVMDYTIYDAYLIGYSWVTVILRKEIVAQFEREVGRRWRNKIELRYSIQHNSAYVPDAFLQQPSVTERQNHAKAKPKPWGTAHALLCAAPQVDGPFVVANADDFYGYHSLKEIFYYLRQNVLAQKHAEPLAAAQAPAPALQPLSLAIVGFELGQTLSANGTVSRGVCHTYVDSQGREWLENIQEHTKLLRDCDSKIQSMECGLTLAEDTLVSMNLFGLQPGIFLYLQQQFEVFLRQLVDSELALTQEFYLPAAVETMLEQKQCSVAMLHSSDPWFGLTYREDLCAAREKMEALIAKGQYPAELFTPQILPNCPTSHCL